MLSVHKDFFTDNDFYLENTCDHKHTTARKVQQQELSKQ